MQTGFVTFGTPYILDYVARMANAALKMATWADLRFLLDSLTGSL
jgi:hypothetical protein